MSETEPDRRAFVYRTPKPISRLKAHVLCMLLRIESTGRTFTERDASNGVSLLTMSNAAAIAPAYAYLLNKIAKYNVTTVEDFDEQHVSWLHGVDAWCEAHQDEIETVRHELGADYTDVPNTPEGGGRNGFACWDQGGKGG